jgi:hypothetical protein
MTVDLHICSSNSMSGTRNHMKQWMRYISQHCFFFKTLWGKDRLCGLVVSVEDYKHRGPGFDSRALLRIFLRELGLQRGPLSLVIG